MFLMLAGVLLLVAILALGFYLHVRALIAAAPKPTPQTVSATEVVALEWQPRLAAVGSTRAPARKSRRARGSYN
jgi:membrane fusion protein (multidrug efflux system)